MEFDETQQAMEDAIRDFCQREIEPCVPALESGKTSPFELAGGYRADGADA